MITINNPTGAIELTPDQALKLGININQDENRLTTKHRGPWQIITACSGLCISATYGKFPHSGLTKITLYGPRSLERPTSGGYELEGRVSIKGKKYSAFTSSIIVSVNGKLINIGVLHARHLD
jgi:hypothetical protein